MAIHPSVAEAMPEAVPYRFVPLPSDQTSDNALHELNYIPARPDPMDDLQYAGEIAEKVQRLVRALQKNPRFSGNIRRRLRRRDAWPV